MDRIGRGIVAGFIATFALSLLLDPLTMLGRSVSTPAAAFGWYHFFAGPVIWGVGFAFAHDHLIGPSWARGVAFLAATACLLLIGSLPFGGAAFFAGGRASATVAAILLVHAVYGALLGLAYGGLVGGDLRLTRRPGDDRLHPSVR
jgi:hypothetical protein